MPSGYRWQVMNYADDEGIVISITLVQSGYKPGSWLDRIFRQDVLNMSYEADLETEPEEIERTIAELKKEMISYIW